MKHWIGEIIGVRLRDLPGARLAGSFPFSDALVNSLFAEHLPAGSPIASIVIEFHEGNLLTAHLRLRVPFVPPLTVQARIERQPDPARAVPLVLRWKIRELGRATSLAGVVLRRFAKLPPWICMESDTVAVDIGGFIAARGYAEVVPYVSGLFVSTEEGQLVVEFALRA
jgi:hypothetical protein